MTFKTLFFSLFLYVCLVWVGAFYLRPNDVQQFGLLWTAIGLIAVLAFIVGARLFGWWRLSRAKAASRPTAPVRPAPMVHEDDLALAALIAEANTNLAKAPGYAGQRGTTPLSGMPLYLLIGPEGSGKTSTFVNSGLDPQLLAGQVAGTGPLMPTRLCNLWMAKGAIFAELSGRAFSGDPARWTQLLKVLRGGSSVPMWRRLWREPEQGLALRGAIAFCDGKEFTGTPNSQALERRSRDLQERLRAVGEVFGIDFPVYQVIAKCDAIPFFPDFFRRLPEPEANQVWGCTLPLREPGGTEVSAEEQAKRITRSFRPLYQELAKRRITQLVHEPDPARRPAVYEFPRELKRIRTPLIQFLSETFRPHPLRLGPLLRGYYLTGIREVEVEVAAANLSETRADWSLQKGRMDTTRLFSAADATRIFRAGDAAMSPKTGGGTLVPRWMFVSDVFSNVILADRTVTKAATVDPRVELYRRGIFAGVCALCFLLCFAFLWSWIRNRALLGEVRAAETGIEQQPGKAPTLAELGALDDLRKQVQRLIDLDHSRDLGMRWFLYSGNGVLDEARQAYFRRFQNLLLNSLNGEIVARLQKMPATPAEDAPYDPTYRLLQTHLMIAGKCDAEPKAVTQVLTDVRREIKLATGAGEPDLAHQQIQFYANELPHEKPPNWRLTENADARDSARRYLQNAKGIDRIYRGILSDNESKLPKPPQLGDLAPKYAEVLKGPAEPSGPFALANWESMQNALKKGTSGAASGDPCVVGTGSDAGAGGTPDAEVARKLQGMFVDDYIKQWRTFVQGFSVKTYGSPDDAAKKLEILADHRSPLLALFYLTGAQTNFTSAAEQPGVVQKSIVDPIKKAFSKKTAKAGGLLNDAHAPAAEMSSPLDITRVFQPVHWVVPPGSEGWVGDKNGAYIQALAALSRSMQEIAANRLDAAAQQTAQTNYINALAAAKQLTNGLNSVGVQDLDSAVETLLKQPIVNTKGFINPNVGLLEAGKVNGQLQAFCGRFGKILHKYPFQPSSGDDISLEELKSWFAAPDGAIWTFAKTLELVVKDGAQWKPNPAAKLQVTAEMLSFLNHAQAITDVFFPGGAPQPLVYSLRPKPDSSLKDWTLSLIIDGQKVDWTPTSSIQKQFTWPAGAGKVPGAVGRIGTGAGGISTPFASRGGIWGIFRIMGDAETREPLQRVVEWKYLRSGDGRKEPLQPPARLEIASFPAGVDVFNPAFFQSLQCPARAVQPPAQ